MTIRTPRISQAATSALITALLLLVVSGCKKKEDEAPEVEVPVQASHPQLGPIAEEIAADAVLAPLAQAQLAARISAPISREFVQRGARVKQGQLLLTLQNTDLQGSAIDSKGALTSAEASYTATTKATIPEDLKKAELDAATAKTSLDVASRTAAERKRLFEQGALSGRDADTAFAAAKQAQVAYEEAAAHAEALRQVTSGTNAKAAQGQLASARGRYINASAQADFANLRSPINGIVTERPFFPGETAPAGTTLLTVMETSSLLAKLHVAQATAQKLKLGGSAEIHIAGTDDPIAASVTFISPALDVGSTTVEVWLKLPNADGRYKVGTPVHAVIRGNKVENALTVPKSALMLAADGSTFVVTITSDSKAHKQPVKVGISTDEAAQIVSGLKPSDTVITDGGYGLDDGTKVTIGSAKAGEDKD